MLKLTPERHRFQPCLIQEYLDREFPGKELYVLHNKGAGVFEIVKPSSKAPWFHELTIIGDHPSKFSKSHVEDIRTFFDTKSKRELAKRHRTKMWAEESDRYEEARNEVMKWRWFANKHPMLGDHPCVRNRAGL